MVNQTFTNRGLLYDELDSSNVPHNVGVGVYDRGDAYYHAYDDDHVYAPARADADVFLLPYDRDYVRDDDEIVPHVRAQLLLYDHADVLPSVRVCFYDDDHACDRFCAGGCDSARGRACGFHALYGDVYFCDDVRDQRGGRDDDAILVCVHGDETLYDRFGAGVCAPGYAHAREDVCADDSELLSSWDDGLLCNFFDQPLYLQDCLLHSCVFL